MDITHLQQFECRQSEDDVKQELELTCTECDEHLCDVEAGDALATLVRVTLDHECEVA